MRGGVCVGVCIWGEGGVFVWIESPGEERGLVEVGRVPIGIN